MSTERLNATFAALADPTRRAILARLASGEVSVNDLAKPFAMSQPAISKHLKVLERAGLIAREVQGRIHMCRLDARPLHAGAEWIAHYTRFWNERLDALQSALDAESAAPPADRRSP